MAIRYGGRGSVAPLLVAVMAAAVLFLTRAEVSGAAAKQRRFSSAEAAVTAAITAARSGDRAEMLRIFGPGGRELLYSGDPVADQSARRRFLEAYDQKHSLAAGNGGRVLVVGDQDWPFPIPIVKKGNAWVFDTAKGKQEILNRRIGQNELDAIQTSLAIVDAEREYAMGVGSRNGLHEYAQVFRSDPGKRNGLYWETTQGEAPSPLGALAAQAGAQGYRWKQPGAKPTPYHGYRYRILKGQGKHAPGGALNYVVNGHMIGGFALVAYPAEYGNSGVMTFIVNHDGIVYQRDLGQNTERIAEAMTVFDPDQSWRRVKASDVAAPGQE